MNVSDIQPLGFRDGSAAMFEVDRVPTNHQEWSEAVGDLPLDEIFDYPSGLAAYVPHYEESYSMQRRKDGSQVRDWWAGDHMWHVDGTRRDKQPVFTVVGCLEAEPECPGTELIDTSQLLEKTIEDGFWKKHGIELKDIGSYLSKFADSTYYREALPFLQSMASEDDAKKIDSRITTMLEKSGTASLQDYANNVDIVFPSKTFPLVRLTPLSNQQALFLDGGVRNSSIITNDGADRTDVLWDLRETYLASQKPAELGLLRRLGWTANKCVIFPQIGTLHRAMPGNNYDRTLHLTFLVSDE